MSQSFARSGTLLLLAALALLPACTPPAALPGGAPPASSASSPLVSSLSVQTQGDTVLFAFRITNPADAPVTVAFASGQTHDFAVRDASGREVWRWSADRAFTQAVQTRTIGAGSTWEFGERWVPPAGLRGALTAVGRLASSTHPMELASAFQLP